MNILVAKNGSQLGPFSESDIHAKLASGELASTDLGWKEGMPAWSPLSQMFAAAPTPPAPPAPAAPPPQTYSPQPQAPPQTYSPQGQPQTYSPQGQNAPAPYTPPPQAYPPQGQQPQTYAPQPYNAPQGQYSAPQTYNSPYPAPYQQGAVQQWNMPGASMYAGFWRRVGAYVIDLVIIYIPLFILSLVMNAALTGSNYADLDATRQSAIVILLIYFAYLCGVVFYFAYMESSVRQATFGKMALGIKVTDLNGNRISLGRGIGRFFSKFLSSFFFGIGYMMAGFTERKQALHDLIVSTLVVVK